jgi:hypothetical protein
MSLFLFKTIIFVHRDKKDKTQVLPTYAYKLLEDLSDSSLYKLINISIMFIVSTQSLFFPFFTVFLFSFTCADIWIPQIQQGLFYTLPFTCKFTVNVGKERNTTIKYMSSIFAVWPFNLFIATIKQQPRFSVLFYMCNCYWYTFINVHALFHMYMCYICYDNELEMNINR